MSAGSERRRSPRGAARPAPEGAENDVYSGDSAASPRPVPKVSTPTTIKIRGARTHNLQGIDLDLPRDALVVITGPSGSGKSSLAYDTIFAEGQRRYVESLSASARL
ncbi:MAG: hypothetical protein R3B09_23265, partial [Nannocystaceae bacterium]